VSSVEVVIRNRRGLHARAAAKFVHVANRFRARVIVTKGTTSVDGKSILGLLTLAASAGTPLLLHADGADGEDAVSELAELVSDGFGELDA
jgi:phosphocarrier protein